MKISFYTLGCKANQFDTQAMERMSADRGHTVVPFDGEWDAAVINSCTVTATSDKKSRQVIRQARRANPDGVVAVCGCYAQMSPNDVEKLDVDVVGGAIGKAAFLDAIEKAYTEKQKSLIHPVLNRQTPFEILESGCLDGRTRALMKVQDGCDNYCTYCIIPYSRGHIRSMPLDIAKAQIRRLAADGYKEVILTGIEISSYGVDLSGNIRLIDLLETLSAAAPEMRIRLGSLEPRTVTEDFCRRLTALKNICRHFHLSLQSGCDATLKRMRRKYDTARYLESVTLLRKFLPDCAITTDLIAGFPGETEEEFAETLTFIEACQFSAMHVFPYSIRKGTPAASMEQIPGPVKDRRVKQAMAKAEQMKRDYMTAQIGKTYEVLFETDRNGVWYGHTDTYLEVKVKSNRDLHNVVCSVHIDAVENDCLIGSI